MHPAMGHMYSYRVMEDAQSDGQYYIKNSIEYLHERSSLREYLDTLYLKEMKPIIKLKFRKKYKRNEELPETKFFEVNEDGIRSIIFDDYF